MTVRGRDFGWSLKRNPIPEPFALLVFLVLYCVMNMAVCEETHRTSSGTLSSPLNTGGSRQCTFIIEQWQGYVVRLQFTDFNLGDDSDNCQNTYLEVGSYVTALNVLVALSDRLLCTQ